VYSSLSITPSPQSPLSKHYFHCIKSINIVNFMCDILCSGFMTHLHTYLYDLVICYTVTLSSLLNKYAPLKSMFNSLKPSNPWNSFISMLLNLYVANLKDPGKSIILSIILQLVVLLIITTVVQYLKLNFV
jgi:hypothetical protein